MKKLIQVIGAVCLIMACFLFVACNKNKVPNEIVPVDIRTLASQNNKVSITFSHEFMNTANKESVNFKYKDLNVQELQSFFNIKTKNGERVNSFEYINIYTLSSSGCWETAYIKDVNGEDIYINAVCEDGKYYMAQFKQANWYKAGTTEIVSVDKIKKVIYTEVEEFKLNNCITFPLYIGLNANDFIGLNLTGFDNIFEIEVKLNKLELDLPTLKNGTMQVEWQYYPIETNLGNYNIEQHVNFNGNEFVDIYSYRLNQDEVTSFSTIKALGRRLLNSKNIVQSVEDNLPGNFAIMFETVNKNITFKNHNTNYIILDYEIIKAKQECSITKTNFTPHIYANTVDLSTMGIDLQVVKGPYSSVYSYEIVESCIINQTNFSTNIPATLEGSMLYVNEEIPEVKNKYICVKVTRKGNELFTGCDKYIIIEVFKHDVESGFCNTCGESIEDQCNHDSVTDYGVCNSCSTFVGQEVSVIFGGLFVTLNKGTYYFKMTDMAEQTYVVSDLYNIGCKFYNSEFQEISYEIQSGEFENSGEFIIIVVKIDLDNTELEVIITQKDF